MGHRRLEQTSGLLFGDLSQQVNEKAKCVCMTDSLPINVSSDGGRYDSRMRALNLLVAVVADRLPTKHNCRYSQVRNNEALFTEK